MSVTLRANAWTPEVSAHGFTSLNIKHKVSCMKHGNDIFTISFTDEQGQDYKMTFYAAKRRAEIVVDDATDERIVNRTEVESETRDIHDAKKFLAACKTYRGDDESVVIDF